MRRRKTADLDVVPHQVIRPREGRRLPLEVLLLRVPARPPAQHAADVEVFAQNVPQHVGRSDPLGRAVVVSTPRRVNVMIAGEPAALRRMRPAREFVIGLLTDSRLHGQRMCLHDVLRPAADLDGVFAGREIHGLAVGSVNLIVKKEVGREPPRRIREHIAPTIANDERCRGWLAIKILHTEHHLHRRSRVEQNRHRVAKAEILRPLPDIESELRLAPPDLARVKLDDAILQRQPRQLRLQRLLVEHGDVEKPMRHILRLDEFVLLIGQRFLPPIRRAAHIQRSRIRTLRLELRRDPRIVLHLD